MLSENDFDNVVAGFYQAASGSMGWTDALVPFQRAMSAIAVQLHAVDLQQGSVAFSYEASDMPAEAALDYIRTYHRIDPRASLAIGFQPGEWINCWERFDDELVANSPFYQEFLIPYGGRYVSGAKLLQDDSLSVILGVHRGHGNPKLDDAELAICKRFGRHLTEALRLHRAHVGLRNQNRLGVELLTRLRAPIALIDEQRRLLVVNPAAQNLISKSSALVENSGCLYCRRPQDDNALMLGLRQLFCGTRPDGVAIDKVFLRARGASDLTPLGLYLYVVRPNETLHAFGDQPLAMLLFHEPGRRMELDPFVVAAAFELTPGEARVAVATARGVSPEQIASQHMVSINTVRSQLQTIFSKTGTARQAELVSLLAGLPMAALRLGDA